MSAPSLTDQTVLCHWAERRYKIENVESVELTSADDGPYSDVTPGDGPYTMVRVTWRKGPRTFSRSYSEGFLEEIINEIIQVALELRERRS